MALAAALTWQGRPEEAEPWVQRAERTLRPEAEPAAGTGIRYVRGLLELARGRDRRRAGRLPGRRAAVRAARRPATARRADRACCCTPWCAWATPSAPSRPWPGSDEQDRDRGEIRIAVAVLRLAQDDPRAATAALAPVLDGSAPVAWRDLAGWRLSCWRRSPGTHSATRAAAGRALERALDIAEPDRVLLPVPHLPCAGAAGAPRPGLRQTRRPGLRDPHPASATGARPAEPVPDGIRGPMRYWEAGSPPVAKRGLGEIVPPSR